MLRNQARSACIQCHTFSYVHSFNPRSARIQRQTCGTAYLFTQVKHEPSVRFLGVAHSFNPRSARIQRQTYGTAYLFTQVKRASSIIPLGFERSYFLQLELKLNILLVYVPINYLFVVVFKPCYNETHKPQIRFIKKNS